MNDATPEHGSIKKLMSHRLSTEDGTVARTEWLQIVEGIHPYARFCEDGLLQTGCGKG